jgi:hypothetical protein
LIVFTNGVDSCALTECAPAASETRFERLNGTYALLLTGDEIEAITSPAVGSPEGTVSTTNRTAHRISAKGPFITPETVKSTVESLASVNEIVTPGMSTQSPGVVVELALAVCAAK